MTDPIELAREYASRPELWEHLVHHDPGQRTFELLRDDDHRYELWDGELWRMSPTKKRHGRGTTRAGTW